MRNLNDARHHFAHAIRELQQQRRHDAAQMAMLNGLLALTASLQQLLEAKLAVDIEGRSETFLTITTATPEDVSVGVTACLQQTTGLDQ